MTQLGVALERLQQAYADRLAAARAAHAAGSGVIGIIGNTVPRELALAVGCLPVLVAAEPGQPTPNADRVMEPVISPETRALFEQAVSGSLEFLDLLVLSRPYAQLYYYLKEVHRLGRAPRLPPLHMLDLMQSQREAVRLYNWRQLDALIDRLQRLSGVELTEDRLRSAIELTNSVRRLQRALLAARWQGRFSGSSALQAIGAGSFMAPDVYAEALSACVAELSDEPSAPSRATPPRLLLLPSEPLSHLHLHHAVEAAGATVVAEDDWWGARAPGDDLDIRSAGSAREALLQKYWLDTAGAGVWPAEAREAWFRAQALRPEIDGVVFYLPPSDHQLGWDYPRLKAWLDERGKPSLLLRDDAAAVNGRAAITARVADWLGR